MQRSKLSYKHHRYLKSSDVVSCSFVHGRDLVPVYVYLKQNRGMAGRVGWQD